MRYISEKIADFLEHLIFSDLTPKTVEISKKCVLDAIGNAFLGFYTPWAQSVMNFIYDERGTVESTVVNQREKVPSPNAALANGTMIHGTDFDDVSESGGHPGAVIISTALSVGEKVRADGRSLIASIVAGYEIMERLMKAVDPPPERSHYARGFHPTATCGTFASAATAGKLLQLTFEQQCNAFGVAGSFSAGSLECYNYGSMTKIFHAGKAAHDGIISAILAKKGLSGPMSIFEGKYGFLKAYSDAADPEALTDQLGKRPFEIDNTTFKTHTGCLYAHSAINGIIDLMSENGLEEKDIEKVSIGLGKSHYRICAEPLPMKYAPTNPIDAQASLPYLAAVAMSYRRIVTPQDFDERKIRNRRLLQVAKKVEPKIDSRFDREEWKDKRPADVVMKTLDGRTLQRVMPYPLGDPKNPLSFDQIKNKYTASLTPIVDGAKIRQIIEIVNILDRVNNIEELTKLLRKD